MAATISSTSIRTATQRGHMERPSRIYDGVVLIALGALSVYAASYQQKADSTPLSSLPPINLCTARRAYDNPSLSREELETISHIELSKLERVSQAAGLACGSLCTLFLGGLDYAIRKKIFHKAPPLTYIAFLTLGAILSYKIQASLSAFLGPRAAQEMIRNQVYSKIRQTMNERLSQQLLAEKTPIFESVIPAKLFNTKCLKSIRIKTWFEPNSLSIPAKMWEKEASEVQSFILMCAGCSVFVCGVPSVSVGIFPYHRFYPRSYVFSDMLNTHRHYRKERCKGSCFGSNLLWLKQFHRQHNFEQALYYCNTPEGREEAYRLSHYQYYVNDEKRAAFLSLILQLPSYRDVQYLPVDGINYSPNMTPENLFALLDTHKGKSLFLYIETSDGDKHGLLLHSSEDQHFIYESFLGVFSFSGRESLALKTSALYFDWHLTFAYAIETPAPTEEG